MVDTHVVVETRRNSKFPEVTENVRFVEQTLRDLADVEAAGVGEDRLSAMASAELASIMKDPMQAMVIRGERLGNLMPDVGKIARRYVQQAEEEPELESVMIRPLVRVVAFLIWADKLAGDYTDPRVEWAEANPKM